MYQKEQTVLLSIIQRFFGQQYDFTAFERSLVDMGKMGLNLCGGSITSVFSNTAVKDLDFYTTDLADVPRACAFFHSLGFGEIIRTDTAISFCRTHGQRKYRVQLITAFHGTPDEVFKSFDFTVCCGAYSFSNEGFTLHHRFLPDIGKRKLVYLGGSRYPICAIYRTVKYQARGYALPGSTAMHLGLAAAKLEIKTYAELKAQIRGIDTMFLGNYLNSLPDEGLVDYHGFIERAFLHLDGISPAEAADEEEE